MDKKDLTTRVARWALLLEEYDYEIEHQRGNRMSHVDALGRYPQVLTITEEDRFIQRVKIGNHEGPIRTSTYAEYMKLWMQYEDES